MITTYESNILRYNITDTQFILRDENDLTKKGVFDVSNLPTGATTTIKLPANSNIIGTTNAGTNGQVPVIDGLGNVQWTTLSTGAANLNDLTDVTITGTPADLNVLQYDGGTSQWINQSQLKLKDNKFLLEDNLTATKQVTFQLDTIPAGQQVINIKEGGELVTNTSNVALTNKTLDSATNTIRASSLATTTNPVVVSGATAPTADQVLKTSNATTASWIDYKLEKLTDIGLLNDDATIATFSPTWYFRGADIPLSTGNWNSFTGSKTISNSVALGTNPVGELYKGGNSGITYTNQTWTGVPYIFATYYNWSNSQLLGAPPGTFMFSHNYQYATPNQWVSSLIHKGPNTPTQLMLGRILDLYTGNYLDYPITMPTTDVFIHIIHWTGNTAHQYLNSNTITYSHSFTPISAFNNVTFYFNTSSIFIQGAEATTQKVQDVWNLLSQFKTRQIARGVLNDQILRYNTAVSKWQNASPVQGAFVGTTDLQTLTNKTFTLPKINDTSSDHTYDIKVSELLANREITLPLLTANDEFVFKNHSQSCTNKDLSDNTNACRATKIRDVVIDATAPTSSQVLTYNGANAIWTTPTAGVTTLDGLSDVTLGALANFQLLQYDTNGNVWKNNTLIKLRDVDFELQDDAVPSKTVKFELGSIVSGNKLLSVIDSGVIVTDTSNTALTNKTLDSATNTVRASSLATTTNPVVVSGSTAPATTSDCLIASSATAAAWRKLALSELATVNAAAPLNGHMLIYNGGSLEWKAEQYQLPFVMIRASELNPGIVIAITQSIFANINNTNVPSLTMDNQFGNWALDTNGILTYGGTDKIWYKVDAELNGAFTSNNREIEFRMEHSTQGTIANIQTLNDGNGATSVLLSHLFSFEQNQTIKFFFTNNSNNDDYRFRYFKAILTPLYRFN